MHLLHLASVIDWPVHVLTDAVLPTCIPPVAGQQCHLHQVTVQQLSAVSSLSAAVSHQPLTLRAAGRPCASGLWASAFIS